MSKSSIRLQNDNADALAEQALRAQQAEAASSGRVASAPAGASPAAVGSSGSVTKVAGPIAAPSASETAAAATTAFETVAVHTAMSPLNASKTLADGLSDAAVPHHDYSSAEIAASSTLFYQDLKGGFLDRFDTQLAALYLEHSNNASATLATTSSIEQFDGVISTASNGQQYVMIDAHAADNDGAALLAQMKTLGSGFQLGSSFEGMVSGKVAVSDLGALLHLSDFGSATEAAHMMDVGLVTSQAVHAEAADTATNEYGVDGSGLKIGVLSDSFNASDSVGINGQPDTMATDIASGDLPTNTTILQDYSYGTDEGRGMAQLIHDIAPGAAIEFATADTGEAGFASNIEGLQAAGAKEIVDDVTYFYEPAFQNGIISQAVSDVVAAGTTYFSSAGNDFDAGWTGAVNVESTAVSTASLFTNLNGAPSETVHLQEFASGEDYIPLSDPSDVAAGYSGYHYNDATYIDVQWNDPDSDADGTGNAGSGPGPTTEFDVFVYDATTKTVIGFSADDTATTGDPIQVVQLDPTPTIGDDIRIYVGASVEGATLPTELKVISEGDGLPYVLGDANTDATAQTFETSYGHNAAPDAITVGAASYDETPAYGAMTPINEFYSSDGAGVTLYYDDNGNRLATPEVLQKVDLTAVDDVDTTFFGYDSDGDGFPNFSGTSAAAPDAAAVGLLMLQVNGNLTPDDIRHLEMDSAIPMADLSGTTELDGQSRDDFTLGYNGTAGAGLVQADAAVGFVETGVIQNAYQDALYGTDGADTIVGGPLSEVIEGGGGADHIILGSGATTLAYAAVSDSTYTAYDTVTGFQTGYDAIDISAVDNGTVALVNLAGGGTEVLYDLVGNAYQGLIYSESPVAATDLFTGDAHTTTVYGSPNGGSIYGDPNATLDYLISEGGKSDFYATDTTDIMTAGSGQNTFHFLDADAGAVNNGVVDQIYGFTSGVDKIDLTGVTNADLGPAVTDVDISTIVIDHVAGGSYITWDATDPTTVTDATSTSTANEIYVAGATVQASDIEATGQGVYIVGAGNGDTLVGGTGNDVLIAGSGTETLTGGAGQDILYAGSGHDTFVFANSQDSSVNAPDYIENFVSGKDTIDLSEAAGTLGTPQIAYDDNGYSYVYFASNTAGGYSGEIVVDGVVKITDIDTGATDTPFVLVGSTTTTSLVGGTGDDVIYAGSGGTKTISITGGGGADVLYAGASGADIFHYTAFSDSTPNAADVIIGFKSGTDKIDLSSLDTGTIDLQYANGYTYIYYGMTSGGTYQGEIAAQGSLVSTDIEGGSGSSFVIDPLSSDVAAMQHAEQVLAAHPSTSIFGH